MSFCLYLCYTLLGVLMLDNQTFHSRFVPCMPLNILWKGQEQPLPMTSLPVSVSSFSNLASHTALV